jgi:RHS repeat-associated protein
LEYTHYDLPETDDLRAKTGLSDLTPTFLMGAISYTEAASMKTWYIRDASGNVLATYEKRGEGSAAPKETMIYGSGRIGMYRHDFMKTRADEDYITGAEARNAYEDKDYQLLPGGSMQLMAGFTFDATTGPRAFEVRTTNGDELFGASQYELTDHLGNVRIGLVDEEGSAITFDATMEADKAEEESQYFMNTDTRHMDPMFNHTAAGAYSSRLNPYLEGGSAIGPAIYLEVSPGDTVAMEVFARYTAQVSDANNVAPALASAIAAGFGGQSPINEAVTLGEAFTEALAAGAAVPTDAGSTAPKAYLQYILFNKNMSMAQHGHHMVSEEAGSSWQHLQLRVPIEEIGYIYIYVANESMDNVDVYFDDLEVQLIDGPVTSASDYYPFGLAMAGRSYSSEHYRFGYQGQFAELDEETGWNSFTLRNYEPVIGRWMALDPYREYASPYVAMGNNPINKVDPNGGCVGDNCPDHVKVGDCMCSTMDLETGETTTYMPNETAFPFTDLNIDGADWSKPWTSITRYDAYSGRPDQDGIVTFSEAIDWYHYGNGHPLYVDIGKMDFKSSTLNGMEELLQKKDYGNL